MAQRSAHQNLDSYDSCSLTEREHSTYAQEKNHVTAFKAKAALAALSEEKAVSELNAEFGVHQTLIHKWVKQLKASAAGLFSGEVKN